MTMERKISNGFTILGDTHRFLVISQQLNKTMDVAKRIQDLIKQYDNQSWDLKDICSNMKNVRDIEITDAGYIPKFNERGWLDYIVATGEDYLVLDDRYFKL